MLRSLSLYFSIIFLIFKSGALGQEVPPFKRFSPIDDPVLSMYEDTLTQAKAHTALLSSIKNELASLKSQMAHSMKDHQKMNTKLFELLKAQIKVFEKMTKELRELTSQQTSLESSK